MKEYFVYILQSQKDNNFYIGCSSSDPKQRLNEHNNGMVKSTSKRRPFKLIYSERYTDKHIAFRREWHLKHPRGYQEKREIIKKITGL